MIASDYQGDERCRPIKGGRYVVLLILFSIPVFGQIYWLYKVLSGKTNVNEQNFARQYLWWLLVLLILLGIQALNIIVIQKVPVTSFEQYIRIITMRYNLLIQSITSLIK